MRRVDPVNAVGREPRERELPKQKPKKKSFTGFAAVLKGEQARRATNENGT